MSTPEERAALVVCERLRALGHQAYFAGGSVRDRLLGRPASDVDVATSAPPEEVRRAFKRTIPVGIQFGIVIVLQDQHKIEVATFRVDGDYQDGRRPSSITFSSAEEDARRRDFTVNGLFWDPVEDRVLDWVGGVADIARGLVRAIGDPDARFDEDKLRILRAPRFAARLGFQLHPATAAAARRRAAEVAVVSPERIHQELVKVLESPTRARGVALCRELGLLPVVLPEVGPDAARAERALGLLPPGASRELAWAALLHLAGPEATDAALRRLRASNQERELAAALVAALPAARGLCELSVAEQKRLLRRPEWEHVPALLRATALAGEGDLEPCRYLRARQAAYAADLSPAGLRAPPLVKGADLQGAGLRPGPSFGRILAAVEAAQLEGRVRTRDEALELALRS